MTDRKLALALALASTAVMVAMVIVSLTTGATQERHEHFAPPDEYVRHLLEHPAAVRALFALDIAFVALYTAFFAALARYLHLLGRPFAYLALGVLLAVTALDIVEDHHILAMLDAALYGTAPDAGAIAWQTAESAAKFTTSDVALVLFGLAIPRDTRIARALALYLVVGTIALAVVEYALPPSASDGVDALRGLGFLAGFALAIAWLRTAPDPAQRA
jgi:hypothetical protein